MKKNLLFYSAVLLFVFCSVQKTSAQLAFVSNRQNFPEKVLKEVPISAFVINEIITGKVTDEKGEPLVGASIVLQGTNKGTIADENGDYKLEITEAEKNGSLVVSFVGYMKQTVLIGGRKSEIQQIYFPFKFQF